MKSTIVNHVQNIYTPCKHLVSRLIPGLLLSFILCSAAQAQTILEAENGSVFSGAQVYPDSAASSGFGVAYISSPGAGVTLNNVPNATTITVRYASMNSGSISIKVNGIDRGNLTFTATSSWTGNYANASLSLNLTAGDNLTFQFDSGDTALNVDYVSFASPVTRATLPPWLNYCNESTCGGGTPMTVNICPITSMNCAPLRSTSVIYRVDGIQVAGSRHLNFTDLPADYVATMNGLPLPGNYAVLHSNVPSVTVRSDINITLSYYQVSPAWGGVTNLNFVGEAFTAPEVLSTVFRHTSYLTAGEPTQIHQRSLAIIASERLKSGLNPLQLTSSFVPTELAEGEGNFSFSGSPIITSGYGNPPHVLNSGGIYNLVMPRFAHEYTHQLFDLVANKHPGDHSCLNEGLADAFPFTTGDLAEVEFGPIGQRGSDFNSGCAQVIANGNQMHEVGNCPFWQVKNLNLLTVSFTRKVLNPITIINFPSCDLTSSITGNAYVVLFTQAADGVDMTQAVNMAGIPNAGSFTAACNALGLPCGISSSAQSSSRSSVISSKSSVISSKSSVISSKSSLISSKSSVISSISSVSSSRSSTMVSSRSASSSPTAVFGLQTDGVMYHLDGGQTGGFVYLCLNAYCQPATKVNGRYQFSFGAVNSATTYALQYKIQDNATGQCIADASLKPGTSTLSNCYSSPR